jgi:hypothetical protein
MAILLAVLLRFTDFDYPFGIFKLFSLFSLITSDVQEELPYYSDLLPSNENEKPIKLDTEPAEDQQDIENEINDTEQKTEDNDEHGMLVN